MKVFISWSGDRSREVAAHLYEWLRRVMSGQVEPWMSDKDLEAGDRWAIGVGQGLDEMNAGISVLTPENLESRWLNFEAGAIGKAFGESRVMTFLIGLSPTDVPQPLGQFQATVPTRDGVLKLVSSLNRINGNVIDQGVLVEQVDMWWPKLEEPLAAIARTAPTFGPPQRSEHEMLEEVLGLLRALARPPREARPGGAGTLTATGRASAMLGAIGDPPWSGEGVGGTLRLFGHIARRIISVAADEDVVRGIRVASREDTNTVRIDVPGPVTPVLRDLLRGEAERLGFAALEVRPGHGPVIGEPPAF